MQLSLSFTAFHESKKNKIKMKMWKLQYSVLQYNAQNEQQPATQRSVLTLHEELGLSRTRTSYIMVKSCS